MATWEDVRRIAAELPKPSRIREPTARLSDEGAKQALVADAPHIYFTTPHFNGYPAVLVQLDHIDLDELRELMTEAWLVRAPKRLARQHGYTD